MYATLGRVCSSQSTALTSNKKFLPPDAPVYFQHYTKMFRYPGTPSIRIPDGLNNPYPYNIMYPDRIKAYYGKDTSPRDMGYNQDGLIIPENTSIDRI